MVFFKGTDDQMVYQLNACKTMLVQRNWSKANILKGLSVPEFDAADLAKLFHAFFVF